MLFEQVCASPLWACAMAYSFIRVQILAYPCAHRKRLRFGPVDVWDWCHKAWLVLRPSTTDQEKQCNGQSHNWTFESDKIGKCLPSFHRTFILLRQRKVLSIGFYHHICSSLLSGVSFQNLYEANEKYKLSSQSLLVFERMGIVEITYRWSGYLFAVGNVDKRP